MDDLMGIATVFSNGHADITTNVHSPAKLWWDDSLRVDSAYFHLTGFHYIISAIVKILSLDSKRSCMYMLVWSIYILLDY